MNKQLIGTLVGALILFFWQFLSWQALDLHRSENQYTDKQDTILQALAENGMPTGHYFLPTYPKGAPPEDIQAMADNAMGKPWAKISYHESFEMTMGMNLFRGFVIDLLAAFFLVWILMNFKNADFRNCILGAVAVGFIGYMTGSYLESVWFKTNTMGDLIDAVVPWGLFGAFLGWYLNRK